MPVPRLTVLADRDGAPGSSATPAQELRDPARSGHEPVDDLPVSKHRGLPYADPTSISVVARGVAARAPVERALVARALDLVVDAVGDAAEPGGRNLAIAGHDLGEAGGGLIERAQ